MKRSFLLFIFVTCVTAHLYGINPFWVQQDKKLIYSLNSVNKSDPREVESYFINKRNSPKLKENLGFGWQIWHVGISGGYIAVTGTFTYFNDSIVSYTVSTELPKEKRLMKRYGDWLSKSFSIELGQVQSLEFNTAATLRPLSQYDGQIALDKISTALLNYMSPSSGTMYGYAGGLSMNLLSNRKNFKNIHKELSTDEIYLLMFSINPASRLTAIEYYKKHTACFKNTDTINQWIELVFKETPKVETLMGCLVVRRESWLLVELYSRFEDE